MISETLNHQSDFQIFTKSKYAHIVVRLIQTIYRVCWSDECIYSEQPFTLFILNWVANSRQPAYMLYSNLIGSFYLNIWQDPVRNSVRYQKCTSSWLYKVHKSASTLIYKFWAVHIPRRITKITFINNAQIVFC